MTTMAEAKGRVLNMLSRHPKGTSSSGIGRVAFPDVDFRMPQGAAFASSKLRRQLQDEGLIRLHIERVHDTDFESWRITQKGRDEIDAAPRFGDEP